MAETAQFDYAKLPDGSYAKFPKGTTPEQMRTKLQEKGLLKSASPAASSPTAPSKSLGERVLDVIGQGAESTFNLPSRLGRRGHELFTEAKTPGGKLMAPLRAESEELNNLLKGLWQSTAPGMIGQPPENKIANAAMMIVGSGEGGEPIRGLEEAAAKPIATALDKEVQTPLRVVMQKIAGAGKEPVLLERLKNEATAKERAANYEKAKADIARDNQEKLGEHAAKMDEAKAAHEAGVKAAQEKYQRELTEHQKASAEQKSAHQEKVAKARREWVDKAMEAKKASDTAAKVSARREALQHGTEAYSDRLLDNIKKTFSTVKGRLDSRWHGLRTTPIKRGASLTVLKDEPLNSPAIAKTIETAENKFLQGSPESIKQFRDLMNWMKEGEGMIDTAEGAKSKLKPITWDEARTHYSALGDRMFSGDLPGNVRQAIRFVRDEGLGKQLRAGAERAGALPQYESLLHDWSNFENDWKDTSSVTLGGGSPLARALKAPSGATLAPQVLGKTGDLLMERLGKYTDAGGSPATAAALRKLNTEMRNLPKVRVPAMPGPIEIPSVKNLGPASEPPAPKEFKSPKAPRMKTADKPEPVPPIDPVAIRKKILTQYAGRPFSYWDVLPPRLFERPALSFEAIRDWVARQPRKELKP